MITHLICDLDGALFDNSQRAHLLPMQPNAPEEMWDKFNAACGADEPIRHVFSLINELRLLDCRIHYLTFRGEPCREATQESIANAWMVSLGWDAGRWPDGGYPSFIDGISEVLHMRQPGDTRTAMEFKRDWLTAFRQQHGEDCRVVLIEDNIRTIKECRELVDSVVHVSPFSGCAAMWSQVTEGVANVSQEDYDKFAALVAASTAKPAIKPRSTSMSPVFAAPYGTGPDESGNPTIKWRWVPVEPTEAMLKAGEELEYFEGGFGSPCDEFWRNMMDAAPQPDGGVTLLANPAPVPLHEQIRAQLKARLQEAEEKVTMGCAGLSAALDIVEDIIARHK